MSRKTYRQDLARSKCQVESTRVLQREPQGLAAHLHKGLGSGRVDEEEGSVVCTNLRLQELVQTTIFRVTQTRESGQGLCYKF